jgi:hypothetical protein
MHQINLPAHVAEKLLAVDTSTERDGGFQKLAVTLQRQLDRETGVLSLSTSDVEKIERYRNQYGQGGWQGLFDAIMQQAQRQ